MRLRPMDKSLPASITEQSRGFSDMIVSSRVQHRITFVMLHNFYVARLKVMCQADFVGGSYGA
jgi:hypothetical protein